MNSITLTGNIVRNVVKTELNEGAYVVNNCIAVKRFGKIEATDFINIKVFGKQVDNFCNLCDKSPLATYTTFLPKLVIARSIILPNS